MAWNAPSVIAGRTERFLSPRVRELTFPACDLRSYAWHLRAVVLIAVEGHVSPAQGLPPFWVFSYMGQIWPGNLHE